MNNVDPIVSAGQQPAHAPTLDAQAWGVEARSLIAALRALAYDAAAPRGERQHSRQYLRRTLRTRFRALEARINAVDPPPPAAANRAT